MRLIPQGEVGELIVAGRNLATGYIHNNESRKFQDNPYTIDLGKNITNFFYIFYYLNNLFIYFVIIITFLFN